MLTDRPEEGYGRFLVSQLANPDCRVLIHGTGRALLRAAIAWIRSRGMSQVVRCTKSGNDAARRLFAELGIRETMREMTLNLETSDPPG